MKKLIRFLIAISLIFSIASAGAVASFGYDSGRDSAGLCFVSSADESFTVSLNDYYTGTSGAFHTAAVYLKGDSDGDGEVTDWDSILFDRYLAFWPIEVNVAALDVDGDGSANDWDAVLLKRYLVFRPVPELPGYITVPSEEPTEEPAAEPTEEPTAGSSDEPASEPGGDSSPDPEPTEGDTSGPTSEPTEEPTPEATAEPTEAPTLPGTYDPASVPVSEEGTLQFFDKTFCGYVNVNEGKHLNVREEPSTSSEVLNGLDPGT
ncbi:MAG: hypothetical protein J6112_05830, partial [Clostridia bacterium]|nr:hypothetical protein [Clostridia bacterium]